MVHASTSKHYFLIFYKIFDVISKFFSRSMLATGWLVHASASGNSDEHERAYAAAALLYHSRAV